MIKIRVLTSILVSLIIPISFWAGGFNFDHRGPEALGCVIGMLALFVLCYSCPVWYD